MLRKDKSSRVWSVLVTPKTQSAGVHPSKGIFPLIFQIMISSASFRDVSKSKKITGSANKDWYHRISLTFSSGMPKMWVILDIILPYLVVSYTPRSKMSHTLIGHLEVFWSWIIPDCEQKIQEGFFCSLTFWLYLNKINGEEKYFSKFCEGILSLSRFYCWKVYTVGAYICMFFSRSFPGIEFSKIFTLFVITLKLIFSYVNWTEITLFISTTIVWSPTPRLSAS